MEELFALIYTSERERGIRHIPKEVARVLASYKGDDLYELLAASVCQSIFVEEGFPVVPLVMNELIEDLADYLRNDLFDRYAEICIAHKGCKQYSDEVFEKLGKKPPYFVPPELRQLINKLVCDNYAAIHYPDTTEMFLTVGEGKDRQRYTMQELVKLAQLSVREDGDE